MPTLLSIKQTCLIVKYKVMDCHPWVEAISQYLLTIFTNNIPLAIADQPRSDRAQLRAHTQLALLDHSSSCPFFNFAGKASAQIPGMN